MMLNFYYIKYFKTFHNFYLVEWLVFGFFLTLGGALYIHKYIGGWELFNFINTLLFFDFSLFFTVGSILNFQNIGVYSFSNKNKKIEITLYLFRLNLYVDLLHDGAKLGFDVTTMINQNFELFKFYDKCFSDLIFNSNKFIFIRFTFVFHCLINNNIDIRRNFCCMLVFELEKLINNKSIKIREERVKKRKTKRKENPFLLWTTFWSILNRPINLFLYKKTKKFYFLLKSVYGKSLRGQKARSLVFPKWKKKNEKLLLSYNRILKSNKNQLALKNQFLRASIGLDIIFKGKMIDSQISFIQMLEDYLIFSNRH